MVFSTRRGAAFFQVGLGAGGLVADLDAGSGAGGDDLGGERAGRLVLAPQFELPTEDDLDPVGSAEVDVVADGGLEPGTTGGGPVEHCGVGDLELADRERPGEPGLAVGRSEGAG